MNIQPLKLILLVTMALTIVVTPINCMGGQGLQLALYADCVGSPVSCGCNAGVANGGNTSVSITTDLVPGNAYYLRIDGFAGDLCDFTVNMEMPGGPAGILDTQQIQLCPNQTFTVDGIPYGAPATVQDTIFSSNGGCDTIVTYVLTPLPYNKATKIVGFCPGESVVVDGLTFTEPGLYFSNNPVASTTGGCDTIFTYNFVYLPQPVRSDTIVLTPAESVVIGGNSYAAPGEVTVFLPANIGCDTQVTFVLLLDLTFPDTCPKTLTFLKVLGQSGVSERSSVICAAADGNFYIAGERGNKSLLLKITPEGKVLWARTFQPVASSTTRITDLIEDSDGMLAGCGIINPDTTATEAYAFRYNPLNGNMIWSKYLKQSKPEAFAIVEKFPGGNFLLLVSPQLVPNVDDAQIWELNRNTGALASVVDNYSFGVSDVWNSMILHDSSLYLAGRHIPGPISVPANLGKTLVGLSKIDTMTGATVWSRLGHLNETETTTLYGTDLIVHDDAILAVSSGFDSLNFNGNSAFFLQKTTFNGDLLWLKRYNVPGLDNAEAHDIQRTGSGYILTGQANFGSGDWNKIVVKTDFDGNVLWAKSVVSGIYSYKTGQYFLHNHQSVVRDDVLYMTGFTEDIPSDILLLKMTADGDVSDSCGFVQAIDVRMQNITDPVNKPVQVASDPYIVASFNAPVSPLATGMPAAALCLRCCEPEQIADTLRFCEGESVTIHGNNYNQPGTVLDTLLSVSGCDTIVTYTLQFIETPNASMAMDCPDDINLAIDAGTGPVAVSYDLPVVSSDCECPGIALTLTQGLVSGSQFPPGSTMVCYQAKDSCDNTAACCFEVFIREESPCDVKTTGCLKWELLGIAKDAENDLTYSIRVTNNCVAGMIYAAFQIPDGLAAATPANNSVFITPAGRKYDVRNPNYSPFYSIRFKSLADSLSNGESDVFQYKLPGQALPAYIHVTARLEPQVFYETHLNTFNCPVQVVQNRQAEQDTAKNYRSSNLKVFPNPTSGALYADFSDWQGEHLRVQVINSQGQRVQLLTVQAGDVPQPVALPEGLSAGLYFLEVWSEKGEKQVVRFVVQR